MPTAGSMLEAFNQQLVVHCGDQHAAALAAIRLPTEMVWTKLKPCTTDFMHLVAYTTTGKVGLVCVRPTIHAV